MIFDKSNIIALSTPQGVGAIAVIRISGDSAIQSIAPIFKSINPKKKLEKQKSHTVHLGHIMDGEQPLDKVLVSLFKAPNSYTGENVIEISCHGSLYIQQNIITLFLKNGCRLAEPGEFTLRAFLNGKMDLSQAEAVADLIASDSKASHETAMNQMRGGFSLEIQQLREELLNFASLIELELDFSEEDVEFANRDQFRALLDKITQILKKLIDSFAFGNVIKNGVPIAIVGEPNVGKSTLLNALLNDEKAIVSDIPGTTRDTIEDQLNINGIIFRFIDTAGIRDTSDTVEQIGIERTFKKIEEAQLIVYLFDAAEFDNNAVNHVINQFAHKKVIFIANKVDLVNDTIKKQLENAIPEVQFISAKQQDGIEHLKSLLMDLVNAGDIGQNETIVTNSRHFQALTNAFEEIQKVKDGLTAELSGDLLAIDIRQALYHLGEITGSVTNDELLGNIFSNFCIGK